MELPTMAMMKLQQLSGLNLRDNEVTKHVDHRAESNHDYQSPVVCSTGNNVSQRVP